MTSLSNSPGTLTGFSKLPYDILVDIIERYVGRNRGNYRSGHRLNQRDAIRISSVNRDTRAAALSISSLWSTVRIEDDRLSALEIVRRFAERTGALGHKLDPTVWIREGILQPRLIALLQRIEHCGRKLGRLHVGTSTAPGRRNHVFEADVHAMLNRLDAPDLLKLDVSIDRLLRLPTFPALRHLGTRSTSYDIHSAPFEQLHSLVVGRMPYRHDLTANPAPTPWDDFNSILSRAHLLQRLEFWSSDCGSADNQALSPLVLPELKVLNIQVGWNDLTAFLARLDAPALNTIYLQFKYDFHDNGHAIPAFPSVTTCWVPYVEYDPNTRLDDLNYGRLFEAMTRLLRAFPATSLLHCPIDPIPLLLDDPHIGNCLVDLNVAAPVSYPPGFDHRDAFYRLIEHNRSRPSLFEWLTVRDLNGYDRRYGSMDWKEKDCEWKLEDLTWAKYLVPAVQVEDESQE